MESLKELYKIGFGPSSSHTMGPAIAAKRFKEKNPDATSYKVELYGSLALTGKGHLTDEIIRQVLGKDLVEIKFNYNQTYTYHANGMKFKAYIDGKKIDEWLCFSVGGGSLKELDEPRKSAENLYKENNFEEVLDFCKVKGFSLYDYVKYYEPDIDSYLDIVYDTMEKSIKEGLEATEVLPGRLKLERKANEFYQKYLNNNHLKSLIFAYTLAVAEQNASGGEIVTAPTCGSSGVVPGAVFAYQKQTNQPKEKVKEALAVAGVIGNIVKANASISGAEVGCQGEIGVACAMAAAALTYLQGGSNEYVEYSAEIALEHHLGMTCDPVDGLVQIPCIERNAMSALFALNASDYSLMTDGKHYVNLDSVIKVMNDTGLDLHSKYKETSVGGLALTVKIKE